MGNECCGERERHSRFDNSNSDLKSRISFTEEAPSAGFTQSEESFHSSVKGEKTPRSKEKFKLPAEAVRVLDQYYQTAGFLWAKSRVSVILKSREVSVSAGHILYRENDPILSVYVTHEGKFLSESEEMIEDINELSALGMTDSLAGERYLTTVKAQDDSSVYEFPIDSFLNSPKELSTAMVVLENKALKMFLTSHDSFDEIQLCSFQDNTELKCRSADMLEMFIIMEGEVQEICGEIVTASRPDWVILRPAATNVQILSRGEVRGCLLTEPIIEKLFGGHKAQILWKSEFIRLLRTHDNFKELEQEYINEIYQKSKFIHEPGERLIASMTKSIGKRIFTVLQGSIKTKSGAVVAREGELYNLEVVSLSDYMTFKENLYAEPGSVIVSTIRNHVYKFFSGKIKKMMEESAILREMSNVQLFKKLPERQVQDIASIVVSRVWKNGEVIYQQGSSIGKMYILLAGKVLSIRNNKRETTYFRHDYFAENAINIGSPTPSTCIAADNIVCWEINFGKFGVMLKDVQQELVRRITTKVFNLSAEQLIINSTFNSPWTKSILIASTLNSSVCYCVLIYSAQCTPNDRKIIDIQTMILKHLKSPYLPYLYSEMVTPLHVLIVFKYSRGMTLRGLLNSHPDQVHEGLLKVYMACILLGLDFLHARNIVYLNLQPETVFIEKNGYPKLVQFRGSQFVYDLHRPGITVTKYSAREVAEGLPITLKTDLWSLGLILFESLATINGCLPADFQETSISETLNSPVFITKVTSAAGELLNLLLLSKDENLDTQAVMNHTWFSSIDWVSDIQADLSEKNGHMRMYIPTDVDTLWLSKGAVDPPISLAEYLQTVLRDKNEIEYK